MGPIGTVGGTRKRKEHLSISTRESSWQETPISLGLLESPMEMTMKTAELPALEEMNGMMADA